MTDVKDRVELHVTFEGAGVAEAAKITKMLTELLSRSGTSIYPSSTLVQPPIPITPAPVTQKWDNAMGSIDYTATACPDCGFLPVYDDAKGVYIPEQSHADTCKQSAKSNE